MNRQALNNDNNAFFALCSNIVDHTDNAKSNVFLCTNILLRKILRLYLWYQRFLSVDGRGHKLRCDTSWACPPRRARLSGGSRKASRSHDTQWSGTAESRTLFLWCQRRCTLCTENKWPFETGTIIFFKSFTKLILLHHNYKPNYLNLFYMNHEFGFFPMLYQLLPKNFEQYTLCNLTLFLNQNSKRKKKEKQTR